MNVWQDVTVGLIVVAAIVYLTFRALSTRTSSACGGGCTGCPTAATDTTISVSGAPVVGDATLQVIAIDQVPLRTPTRCKSSP